MKFELRHFVVAALLSLAGSASAQTVVARGVRGRNSDNTRLRQVLGWEPAISLEQGLARTYPGSRNRCGPRPPETEAVLARPARPGSSPVARSGASQTKILQLPGAWSTGFLRERY